MADAKHSRQAQYKLMGGAVLAWVGSALSAIRATSRFFQAQAVPPVTLNFERLT